MKKRTNGKPFFDTNVLVYAFCGDDPRTEAARALIFEGGVTGVQAFNEFVAAARRKTVMSWKNISDALAAIRALCPSPVDLTIDTHEAGLRIAERYGYHIFDALMIAAALEASCGVLYSEDMQDGQVIDGLTIRNPFVRK